MPRPRPTASVLPSGEKATLVASTAGALIVILSRLESTSQSDTMAPPAGSEFMPKNSRRPAATVRPSGENATDTSKDVFPAECGVRNSTPLGPTTTGAAPLGCGPFVRAQPAQNPIAPASTPTIAIDRRIGRLKDVRAAGVSEPTEMVCPGPRSVHSSTARRVHNHQFNCHVTCTWGRANSTHQRPAVDFKGKTRFLGSHRS
jgi:hypothetical protein